MDFFTIYKINTTPPKNRRTPANTSKSPYKLWARVEQLRAIFRGLFVCINYMRGSKRCAFSHTYTLDIYSIYSANPDTRLFVFSNILIQSIKIKNVKERFAGVLPDKHPIHPRVYISTCEPVKLCAVYQ